MPHRALMVNEILREVAAQVTETHPPTAVALACCAKFLEEPTLSALWKIQNYIPTLFKTLPPDSWEIDMDETEDIIVRDLPQTRRSFTLLEDSKLKSPVFGVVAHSGPVERGMGQAFKIRVLVDGVGPPRCCGYLRRGVRTALCCDLRWPRLPPTPTPDLDVLVRMGTHATIPLTTLGICGLPWR